LAAAHDLFMTVQPVPKPATYDEYEAVKPLLIDTAGNPLKSAWCGRCQHSHFTVEPCAADVPYPQCGSTGVRCLRPSEHEAAAWHRGRVVAFDKLRDELEAAGYPQVAPWPAAG
jgi:hypothetical protein